MCFKWKGVGDVDMCQPKVLEQGDGKSQKVWGSGARWASPPGGTPGTLQNQVLVDIIVRTRAFAEPWTGVTCPPLGPHVRKLCSSLGNGYPLGAETGCSPVFPTIHGLLGPAKGRVHTGSQQGEAPRSAAGFPKPPMPGSNYAPHRGTHRWAGPAAKQGLGAGTAPWLSVLALPQSGCVASGHTLFPWARFCTKWGKTVSLPPRP